MSGLLVAATGVAYAYIAVEQWILGNKPMSICYAGYAFANVGLWMGVTK